MDHRTHIDRYLQGMSRTIASLPRPALVATLRVLEEAYGARRQVFLAGNGGSAATAIHMANDLLAGVARSRGRGFRAVALPANMALVTALANDVGYGEIFAEQLRTLADPRDVLIVFSGSGNSENIILAIEEARRLEMTTIGVLGMGGGRAADLVDLPWVVPADEYGPIEDIHMMFDHLVTAYFMRKVSQHTAGKDQVTSRTETSAVSAASSEKPLAEHTGLHIDD